jgi:RHS repeat-associated protein
LDRDFAQLTRSYQAHGGEVNTGMTPQVQYSYADGSSNTIRITGMTYPNGRNVVNDYGATGSMNDAASRIFGMKDSGASSNLVEYSYLGLSGFVKTVYPESSAQYTLIGTTGGTNPDSGDIYLGLDRFGRVIDANWANVAGTATLARVKYGYNRVSSRTWRDNLSPGMTGYDELYSYDQLQRLQNLGRGTLNGTQTAITSPTFGQDWTLDETGNWNGFRQSDNGTTWNLDQARTANTVNEITSLVNETSKAWTTPGYDKAGNMTRIPVPGTLPDGVAWNTMSLSDWDNLKLADWEEMTLDNVEGVYDAWNRLVRLHVGDTTLAEYTYDARGYRIRKDSYTDGTLTEARHFYYTPGWQVVEERVGTSTSAERQFVWGLRYIDDLVLRDRDTDGNGTLDERRYSLQDGNWNTIALTSTSGTVTERFSYDAYGVPTFLTGAGTVQASSATGWETLYAGYRWDGDPSRMYYVRNRFLQPYVGTWNRRDPVGHSAGMNLQGYVNDMPIQAVDAFGLQPWDSRGSYLGSGYFEQRVNGVLEGLTQLLFGGRFKAPSDGELYGRSYETPTGGVGGISGGVARDLTLRTVPIERNPSDFSLMGLDAASDFGVSGPFGAVNHLCYGTSNSGREPRSRTCAAAELAVAGIGMRGGLGHRFAAKPGGRFDGWLAAGAQGGARRNLAAWRLNRFRNNTTRFYGVFSDNAAARLAAGGDPWPTGLSRANLGEGLYVWGSRTDAANYLQLRQANPAFDEAARGTQIRSFLVGNDDLNRFSRLDLRNVDEFTFQGFIDNHTEYADKFLPHGFEYVIYPRAVGTEHFFDRSVFHHFQLRQ